MNRAYKIIITQFKALSIGEFLRLIKKSLFSNDPILVYALRVSSISSVKCEPIDFVRIEKGSLDDLEKLGGNLKPLPWEFQCHRFDGVEDCFVAKNEWGIQHISWIYYHFHRNRLLRLGSQEAEIKFCLTLPSLRGLGIYPRVIRSIVDYLEGKGIRQVFMCVHMDNQPSIRGIEKAGFRRVGKVQLLKILGLQISRRFDTTRVK